MTRIDELIAAGYRPFSKNDCMRWSGAFERAVIKDGTFPTGAFSAVYSEDDKNAVIEIYAELNGVHEILLIQEIRPLPAFLLALQADRVGQFISDVTENMEFAEAVDIDMTEELKKAGFANP